MAHAKLSPSSAIRWRSCTKSVSYIDELIREGKIPEKEESTKFSKEGTELHKVFADALSQCLPMLMRADWWETEKRVDIPLSRKVKTFGTADMVGYASRTRTAYVLDWKFGKGIRVDARENPQLALYALGWRSHLKYHKQLPVSLLHLSICQPRINAENLRFTDWVIDTEQLDSFLAPFVEAAENIEEGSNIGFRKSEAACRFCRAKPVCPEYNRPQASQGDLELLETKLKEISYA